MSAQFPIVDAHQHFWDPRANYHPWLCDQPPIPFRYGDYSALRRPYLPADYFADAGRHEVVKTVYVETEWDPRDPVGETAWVERLRRETGFPTVMVAQAWLDRDDVAAVLERQAAFGFVRGVRHKPRPGAMRDARWRAGYALLARFGLRFDLQAPWTELADAVALCRAFPGTPLVLDHAGLPADRSAAGIAGWQRALRLLAACPNAAIKISGLGVPGRRWTPALNREIVLLAIEIFGVQRAMFASNFPVDGLCASFDEVFSGFHRIARQFSAPEQRALFHDNAIRIYAMG
ncbi:MAG TPA: amidohydrolase family protein [Burkholderiales bacterium]|nr:amidohydrolase family protein [Burkholderiales bacterium]